MRRTLLAALVATALVGLAAAVVYLIRGDPDAGNGITRENLGRIQQGMTEEEVRQIRGCRPGHHGAARRSDVAVPNVKESDAFYRYWATDEFIITVKFDWDMRVVWAREGRWEPGRGRVK